MSELYRMAQDFEERIVAAINIVNEYGDVNSCDGKAWMIDQILRILLKDEDSYQIEGLQNGYEEWVEKYEENSKWNVGIKPTGSARHKEQQDKENENKLRAEEYISRMNS